MRLLRYIAIALLVVAGIVLYRMGADDPADDLVAATNRARQMETRPTEAVVPKEDNIVVLQLKDGPVEIEMLPNLAPNHVARIKELVQSKFYDGLKFHRVMDGFMAQTGDPLGNGTGGSGKRLNAEFTAEEHVRGIVSMARSPDRNSADSQFFIVLKDSLFLDRNYTAWGRVLSGMEYVDMIKKGDERDNGAVLDPDVIVTMRMKAGSAAAQ